MGLDQHLHRKVYAGYKVIITASVQADVPSLWEPTAPDRFMASPLIRHGGHYVLVPVAEWRKAYQIQGWFERDATARDSCLSTPFGIDVLESLRDLCVQVKEGAIIGRGMVFVGARYKGETVEDVMKPGEFITNPKHAHKLLPTDFRLNQVDYDQFYLAEIERTIMQLDWVIATHDEEDEYVYSED